MNRYWRMKRNPFPRRTTTPKTPNHAFADRRLRRHRRLPERRAGGQRRLARLALSPPVRFRRLLRRPARHARQRTLEDRAGRGSARSTPEVPARHADPGDGARDRRGCRHVDRSDAHLRPRHRRRPHRRRKTRPRADAHGVADSLRVRGDRPLGARDRGRHRGRRRPRSAPADHNHSCHDPWRGTEHRRAVLGRPRRTRAVRSHLVAVSPSRPGPRRCRTGTDRD